MEDAKMNVRVSLGKTINIGNFESLRIDIAIEDEIPGKKSYADGIDMVYRSVSEELEKKIEDVRKRFSR